MELTTVENAASPASVQCVVHMPVAILCVARNSIYKQLSGVECYDIDRDARTFCGGMPIVAHPPCRAWSKALGHQAKPLPGEKELGPMCVDLLKQCGGVLEHPKQSRLWEHCDLPEPGEPAKNGVWSIEVHQSWWGYEIRKPTWLLIAGVSRVAIPVCPPAIEGERQRYKRMSKNQRSATVPAFARWLIEVARSSSVV